MPSELIDRNFIQPKLTHRMRYLVPPVWFNMGHITQLCFLINQYVAASTLWMFLPYDLITIQNWCHLY